ncbi:ciliogenesis and planar polarity effector 1 isoform X3 [Varanus komodoensis]|uniref:ciliogenesis and planar polarity effector 1 isoform X3 n=1 Tax=Varanus komodoensis TaxID=61221 RepID=UPI001CF7928C|nr:ciliogenesis and planar polarity effector 1 isoform X3 [Varanus komodoensis]
MEIKLEVLASTCIKQKKPWPRITWLGQEKEAVFLLDDKNINEINLLSGRTRKKIPQLHSLLKNVFVLTTSRNGAWLAGILKTGELFLWNKDQDTIKHVPAVEETTKIVTAAEECSTRLHIHVSGDGNKVILATSTLCVLLWESTEYKNAHSKSAAMGQWSQIIPEASVVLPSIEEKETTVSAVFIKNEMLGDCCLCSFAFFSEEQLMLTFLEVRWQQSAGTFPCQIHWAQKICSLSSLTPHCESVKSRGALLTAFSHDGLVLAVGVNQKDPQATQILFTSTMNFITVTGSLKGCGNKNKKIPCKFIRSYWIADMSWTSDSLFLACMLKRGSLILTTCLGELLTLVTYGCSVEFGPAEFIPLHPLITYRSQHSLLRDSNHSHDSSVSEGDSLRQRFSITSHPSLPYLIASDGYLVTVLKFSDSFSPSAYMRSLFLDSAQRLEKLHRRFITSKSKGKRLRLQSLSSLRAKLLKHHQNQSSTLPDTPAFLQEKERTVELNEELAHLQDYDEESDDDKVFQSRSFIFGSQKTDSSSCGEGCLEFASMFDTIHAVQETREMDDTSLELNCIQKNLIAAWRVGISESIQERDMLLNCIVHCVTHFFSILQYAKLNFTYLDDPVKNHPWIQCTLKCFEQFLTLLSWEYTHRQTLGHLMKLTSQTLKMMLLAHQDHFFSSNLLGGFSLLKKVTHYLNSKNTPQHEILSAVLGTENKVELDCMVVPLFQAMDWNSDLNLRSLNSVLKLSPPTVNLTKNPEKRLIVMWRLLYKHVIWYWAQLNRKAYNISKPVSETQIAYEGPIIEVLASHIQAVLQSSGERLEQTLILNTVVGEEQFLLGSYKESVEAWEKALQEAKEKGGKRMPFLQTRYYLAMLYCHLYYYNLSEAQGLCDHLVSELLKRSQISERGTDDVTDAECMIRDVHSEAALAVVQSLARFMAAYFTNEPLYVLPPHNVDILPSLHIKLDRCHRVVPLQHALVTRAVRAQCLSSVWTVDYALDLLLIGGLIPEAVWLAHKLGDWKVAVSVGLTYNLYCQSNDSFPRSGKVELCLPLHLTPTQIFQEKLQFFLGRPVNSETSNERDPKFKQFTDPLEEEDVNVLFNSVEEILKAAAMAEADILSETFQLLVDIAKDLSRKFYGLVPDGLYLPAPPLYCPQPTFLSEEECFDLPLKMERGCRQKVSGVIQRILLLFRAAHCSFPVAQWYISQLKRARKIMQKIRKKGALPSLGALPENLLNYSKCHTVFLRPTSSGDHGLDDVSCKTIGCFRELCALCWMFHIRERLSDSCRRYQSARENLENEKKCKRTEYDACVIEHSLSALEWACRILPFARFMNVEELVQDIILSLIGELPPIKKVAEILVKAFPNPEDVRVPLREKYNTLHQRLRHCIVKGHDYEEMMSVAIQSAHKVNVKTLKRVIRNIGHHQRNIWEPPEEEVQDPGVHCCDRFSLETSLSRSTVSDLGNPQVYSDAETVESLSEELLMEETKKSFSSQMQENHKKVQNSAGELIGYNKTTEKLKDFNVERRSNRKESSNVFNQHFLPLVGEWEFEREDDEYIKFLDLFLTYLLERDQLNHKDYAVPFLISFSALLREHELNSVLFDVHTTLKRRQIRTKDQNVFRAGSCYTLAFESIDSKLAALCAEKKKDPKKRAMPFTVQRSIQPSLHDSMMSLTARRGLFGLSQQPIYGAHDSSKEITLTPVLTQRWSEEASSIPRTVPGHKYFYKAIQENDLIQREEPTPEMNLKYSNIARLLEWMIRWSNRRLLYDPILTEPFHECQPVMHVKTSASAILASLWMLEQHYGKTQDQNKPYRGCVSTYSSANRSKLGEDICVDGGCSPSAGTPVHIQDKHAYAEPNESTSRTLCEKQFEQKDIDLKEYSITHDIEVVGTDFDAELTEEIEGSIPDEVDVTSENKDYCEDTFAVSRSPTISVSVKCLQQRKEQLSISDAECPQKEPLRETLEEEFMKLDGTTFEVISSNIPLSYCPEKTKPTSTEISVSDDQPSFTVVSSVLPSDPVGPKKEEIDARDLQVPPPDTSEAVRQMLQDEMFKLVQLQQINFMSLMQIVGSSFASLPNLSQQMQQSQPFPLGRNQATNDAGTNVGQSLPKHQSDDFPKAQSPTLENTWNVNKEHTSPGEKKNLHEQSHNGNISNSAHINNSSGLPGSRSSGARLIPPFQSLLHQVTTRPLPLLTASLHAEKKPKLIPLAKPSNNVDGFPLLKLKSNYQFQPLNICPVAFPKSFAEPFPQQREAWGPAAPPPMVKNPQDLQVSWHNSGRTAQLNLNNCNHEVVRQVQEQMSHWAENVNTGTSMYLPLDDCEKKRNMASSQHFYAHLRAEKRLVDNELPLYKSYKHFTEIPLLYLKPRSQTKEASSLMPDKHTRMVTDSRDPFGQTGLPLLYATLPQLTKFQTPKLIPLQTLLAFEQSCQDVQSPLIEHKNHQLLKCNIKPCEARQDKKNKREKRRVEKQIKEKDERKKTTMNFQQGYSVVLTDVEQQAKCIQEELSYDLGDGDSLLNPEPVISSAELHYLASVRKRTADLQDASTNTDAVIKLHQDIQTVSEEIDYEPGKNQPITSSASVTVLQSHPDVQNVTSEVILHHKNHPATPSTSVTELWPSGNPQTLPPDLCLNCRFPTEVTEKPLPSSLSDIPLDLTGRNYIEVVDIENDDFLKNLPDTFESVPKHITAQPVKTEFPTSAKLHHMAASVTNVIPPEEFKNEVDILQSESPQVSPETEASGDPLTLRFLHEDFSTKSSTEFLARKISKQQFSTKLKEMNRQLLTLQNMAERMEKEFRNTKLLVKTVDAVMEAEPREDDISFFASGVRLSKEEHYSSHVRVENLIEVAESSETEPSQSSYIVLQTPSISSSASAANLPTDKKTSTDIKFRIGELDESVSEDCLQITGLSGVSDIITDLIEGGVSASELGLTEIQSKKVSSLSRVASRHSHKIEKDRKELQTWMKRKRKERLAEYLQTLAEQRAKEHNPFHLRKKMPLRFTTRDIELQQQKKDEKDKALLTEHYNRRISEALTLMHELLSDSVKLSSTESNQLPKIRSPHDFKQSSASSPGRHYHGSYQAARKKTAAEVGLGWRSSCDITQRKSRICQAPYRRMISTSCQRETRWKGDQSHKPWSSSSLDLRSQAPEQTRESMSQRRFLNADSVTQGTEESDDAVSVWSVPDEIQQILYGSSKSHSKKDSFPQDDSCSTASFNTFNSVSDSTSSILSKLDWNAVEAMVANVEGK